MSKRIRRALLTKVIPLTCATCGSPSKLYPGNGAKGIMVRPKCSPPWLESFAQFCLEQLPTSLMSR